jgi:hypothetical protein
MPYAGNSLKRDIFGRRRVEMSRFYSGGTALFCILDIVYGSRTYEFVAEAQKNRSLLYFVE